MIRLFLLLVVLSGCNTPSQPFRGVPATRVTVEGSTFDVRVRDNTAEAIRINPQYAPRFGPIRERARVAMAQVSGCKVTKVGGDQAMAVGTLKCGKSQGRVRKQPETLECIPVRGISLQGVGSVTVDVDCYPT